MSDEMHQMAPDVKRGIIARQISREANDLRIALTRARDRLECHRDPMAAEIDKELGADPPVGGVPYDKVLSMLRNARNILRDGGYVYASEIDRVLNE